jgi:hypothetical protein
VCVRYRYDETTKERWKTGELISEQRAWEPPPLRWAADTVVAVQVAATERAVRQRVKAAGGKGNPRQLVWELSSGQVQTLRLTDRIGGAVKSAEPQDHLPVERSPTAPPSTGR